MKEFDAIILIFGNLERIRRLQAFFEELRLQTFKPSKTFRGSDQ
jgi:hypothetical protein